jgi:hypothetical protein
MVKKKVKEQEIEKVALKSKGNRNFKISNAAAVKSHSAQKGS